jgi:HD-like signal output (HDOD) protein
MFDLDKQKLQSIESGFHIPSKPKVLSEMTTELEGADPSLERLASIIAKDINLSSLLLKTINSPLFGLQRTITDIPQATMVLGFVQLKRLVTVALLRESFSGDACISLERFWDESLEVANACIWIGKEYKSLVPADYVYTLGLFHNVGLAAMAIKFKDYVDVLKEDNENTQLSITQLENAKYNCDHAVIGYYIASSWHLPKSLCDLILNHHEANLVLEMKDKHDRVAFSILKCAENAVYFSRYLENSKEWSIVGSNCLEELGLSDEDYSDLVADFADS